VSIDGIWALSFYGVWESAGILVLENGRAIGGGYNHYSRGSYETGDGSVRLSLTVDYFGTPRTLFGEKTKEFPLEFEGSVQGSSISGSAFRPDKKAVPLQFQLTRRADVPSA
jgi:hypothetical protein